MNLPYVETNMFKMLQSFCVNGDMKMTDFSVDLVFLTAGGNKRTIRETIKRLLERECIVKIDDGYRIKPKAKEYVEDVLNLSSKKPIENLVQPPYRNIWTAEIRGYTKNLYANKRGYQGKI